MSLNSQALLCEELTGRSTLGFLHSAYALGALFGVLYGGALVQIGISVLDILILLVFISTPLSFVFMFGLMSFTEESEMRKTKEAVNVTDEEQKLTAALKVNLVEGLPCSASDFERHDVEAVNFIPLSSFDDEDVEGKDEGIRRGFPRNHLDTDSNIAASPTGTTAINSTDPISAEKDRQKVNSADYRTLILLCSLGGLAYTGEGSVGDWSTVYLVINLRSSPLVGVLGFAIFQLVTAIVRYFSDFIVEHVDRKVLLQAAGFLAGLGLAIAAAAPSLPEPAIIPIAIVGFGICGAGLSVVAPIVVHFAG